MKQRIFIGAVLMLLNISAVVAQKLTVESFALAAADLSAATEQRLDLNEQPCALVKVQLAVRGAIFDGNCIGKTPFKAGEYWVYMTQGSQRLKVMHPNFLPLSVEFDDYGVPSLEGKHTYVLTLLLPEGYTPPETIAGVMDDDEAPGNKVIALDGLTFNMIYVQGGTFRMGGTSEQGSDADTEEKPVHEVTLSGYYIGETEVTQALWQKVMGTDIYRQQDVAGTSRPLRGEGENYPMYYVSWEDCQAFLQKLNAMTNQNFSLPTEAQWEFAARGGREAGGHKYSGSGKIGEVAWCYGNSQGKIQPVATKSANELGVYDMAGNVAEWCRDWQGNYPAEAQTAPVGPESGIYRVVRGGGWNSRTWRCRTTARSGEKPSYRNDEIGFRLVLEEIKAPALQKK